jgi:hypothetical protein
MCLIPSTAAIHADATVGHSVHGGVQQHSHGAAELL